jgi:hypothetical protein
LQENKTQVQNQTQQNVKATELNIVVSTLVGIAGGVIGATCATWTLRQLIGYLVAHDENTEIGVTGFLLVLFFVMCLGAIMGAIASIRICTVYKSKKESTHIDKQ